MSDSEDDIPWVNDLGYKGEQQMRRELGPRGFVVHVRKGHSASELAALEEACGLPEGTLVPCWWLTDFMMVVEVRTDHWQRFAAIVEAMLKQRSYSIVAHGRNLNVVVREWTSKSEGRRGKSQRPTLERGADSRASKVGRSTLAVGESGGKARVQQIAVTPIIATAAPKEESKREGNWLGEVRDWFCGLFDPPTRQGAEQAVAVTAIVAAVATVPAQAEEPQQGALAIGENRLGRKDKVRREKENERRDQELVALRAAGLESDKKAAEMERRLGRAEEQLKVAEEQAGRVEQVRQKAEKEAQDSNAKMRDELKRLHQRLGSVEALTKQKDDGVIGKPPNVELLRLTLDKSVAAKGAASRAARVDGAKVSGALSAVATNISTPSPVIVDASTGVAGRACAQGPTAAVSDGVGMVSTKAPIAVVGLDKITPASTVRTGRKATVVVVAASKGDRGQAPVIIEATGSGALAVVDVQATMPVVVGDTSKKASVGRVIGASGVVSVASTGALVVEKLSTEEQRFVNEQDEVEPNAEASLDEALMDMILPTSSKASSAGAAVEALGCGEQANRAFDHALISNSLELALGACILPEPQTRVVVVASEQEQQVSLQSVGGSEEAPPQPNVYLKMVEAENARADDEARAHGAQQERADAETWAAEKGLEIVVTKRDGNCVIEALREAARLQGCKQLPSATDVRNRLVTLMEKQKDRSFDGSLTLREYIHAMFLGESTEEERLAQVNDYMDAMRRDGTYLELVALNSAAQAFKAAIVVRLGKATHVFTGGQERPAAQLTLVWLESARHVEATAPKSGARWPRTSRAGEPAVLRMGESGTVMDVYLNRTSAGQGFVSNGIPSPSPVVWKDFALSLCVPEEPFSYPLWGVWVTKVGEKGLQVTDVESNTWRVELRAGAAGDGAVRASLFH